MTLENMSQVPDHVPSWLLDVVFTSQPAHDFSLHLGPY